VPDPAGGVAVPDDDVPWLRTACREDAEAIGRVTVDAWRRAYPGLLPRGYLDGLDVGERVAFWRGALTDPPPGAKVFVACSGAAVVGFAACGPEEFGSAVTGRGQVYALNVTPAAWGRGAGTALLTACHERLVAAGYAEAVLWVLPGNRRARDLYERHGWRTDGVEKPVELFGITVLELMYRRRLPNARAGEAAPSG
jgi:ribosomal protein S18 acetylase RimI-like enzyme